MFLDEEISVRSKIDQQKNPSIRPNHPDNLPLQSLNNPPYSRENTKQTKSLTQHKTTQINDTNT